jgi:hypothetical protein
VIYPLLPPGACAALNGAITDPAANSEKGALSFCALCQGAPPAPQAKLGGDRPMSASEGRPDTVRMGLDFRVWHL